MKPAPRVLLFHEDRRAADDLRIRLAHAAAFQVTHVHSFLQAAPFLAEGRTDLLLIYLPEIEWVRNALLTEIRRVNALLPIVAITSILSDDLFHLLARFGVTAVLSARDDGASVVEAVRKVLSSRLAGTSKAQS